jgi:hypothetical protein
MMSKQVEVTFLKDHGKIKKGAKKKVGAGWAVLAKRRGIVSDVTETKPEVAAK